MLAAAAEVLAGFPAPRRPEPYWPERGWPEPCWPEPCWWPARPALSILPGPAAGPPPPVPPGPAAGPPPPVPPGQVAGVIRYTGSSSTAWKRRSSSLSGSAALVDGVPGPASSLAGATECRYLNTSATSTSPTLSILSASAGSAWTRETSVTARSARRAGTAAAARVPSADPNAASLTFSCLSPTSAASPFHELRAGLGLQPGHMVADRRLSVVQSLGRGGNGAVPGDRDEHAEPDGVQHALNYRSSRIQPAESSTWRSARPRSSGQCGSRGGAPAAARRRQAMPDSASSTTRLAR